MREYSEIIAQTIPEFFFVWSVSERKIIYLSENEDLNSDDQALDSFDIFKELIHPDQQHEFHQLFKDINQGKYYQNQDFKSADYAATKHINIRTFPVKDNGKVNKIAGHIHDVTKRIEKEQRLKRESQQMEDVLHILAHDLRGPLGNIINMARLQLRSDSIDTIKSFSEIMVRVGFESSRLIDSMIELVEIESMEFELEMSNCNLMQVIKATLEPFKEELKDKNIEIKTSTPANLDAIKLDLIKFRLVLQNLISNAIKFTENGGSIEIIVQDEVDTLQLIIKDDGIGIPENKLPGIFEKFSNARRKGLRGEKSTGLGLSIVKKVVELHKGEIKVNSIVGDGTEFIINLPKEKLPEKRKIRTHNKAV